ncbi:uncharacterized protein CTRU02_215448 [Colletotrichum truncatum]|uniref:Uncharacterized protein n=1 Tax=Colletotrichum truncatum TaxID=5467 RepID=A0ACC3YCJ1_COLTU|nr:uncharacterized protein CTRU02_05613 [Colletotrichum truncatum]KAF6794056.1 hypothetical protein CTRU02_05613 [Colletotrichum truncatum]
MSDEPLPSLRTLPPFLPLSPSFQTKALQPACISRWPAAKQPPLPAAASPSQSTYPDDKKDSIGSLLLAYPMSSGESLIMSPDGSASQRDSAPVYASDRYETRGRRILTTNLLSSVDNEHHGAQSFTVNKGLPPHLANYNKQGPLAPAKPDQTPTVGSPTSLVSSSLPQRPFWGSSSVKSNRKIEVSELQLAVSCGSTAALQPYTAQTSYSVASPATERQQQSSPRSTSNVPRRHTRPVPFQNQTSEAGNMGQEVSTSKGKISHLRDGQEDANWGASYSEATLSPTQCLPTSNNENEDVKVHIVDRVVSPVLIALSPGSACDQPNSKPKPPIPHKAVTARNLQTTHSLPQMRVGGPVTSNETPLTITRDFAVSPVIPHARNQLSPRSAHSQQKLQKGQWQQLSRENAHYAPRAPAPSPAQGDQRPTSRDPRPHPQPDDYRRFKIKGRPAVDPRPSYFLFQDSESPSLGIIYKALPLKERMLDCYVKHRVMDRTRNRKYALTCQTCGKADTEDRYQCQFCYVRMCGSCLQVFNSNRRDLRKLMAHLEGNPHSGGSQKRPATAASIEPTGKMGEQKQHTVKVSVEEYYQAQSQQVAA